MLILSQQHGEAVVVTLADGQQLHVEVVEGGPCWLSVEPLRSAEVAKVELRGAGRRGQRSAQRSAN